MKRYKQNRNAIKLASALIERHNKLVFERLMGSKDDRLLAFFMESYKNEIIHVIVDCNFDFVLLREAFIKEAVFAGQLDKPYLDDMATELFDKNKELMFEDVFADASNLINKMPMQLAA